MDNKQNITISTIPNFLKSECTFFLKLFQIGPYLKSLTSVVFKKKEVRQSGKVPDFTGFLVLKGSLRLNLNHLFIPLKHIKPKKYNNKKIIIQGFCCCIFWVKCVLGHQNQILLFWTFALFLTNEYWAQACTPVSL